MGVGENSRPKGRSDKRHDGDTEQKFQTAGNGLSPGPPSLRAIACSQLLSQATVLTQLPTPMPSPPSSLLITSLQSSLGETRKHIDSNARFLRGEKRFPSSTVQRRANSDSVTRTQHLLTYPLLKLKAHYNLWSHFSGCLLPSPHAVFRRLINDDFT